MSAATACTVAQVLLGEGAGHRHGDRIGVLRSHLLGREVEAAVGAVLVVLQRFDRADDARPLLVDLVRALDGDPRQGDALGVDELDRGTLLGKVARQQSA